MIPIPSRLQRLLRLPALVLLLIAVLVNPVFAAVGDLHEAARGVAEHLHDAPEQSLALDSMHDEDGHGNDLMHALMHGAHCCGHINAIPATFILNLARPYQIPVPHLQVLTRVSANVLADLRPPISH